MNNKNQKYNLAAINSINWVRIIGQIVYYFWSYFKVEKNLKPINYVVQPAILEMFMQGLLVNIWGFQ